MTWLRTRLAATPWCLGALLVGSPLFGVEAPWHEPLILAEGVDGRLYTPRLCPHDPSVYGLEALGEDGNHQWIVFEDTGRFRQVRVVAPAEADPLGGEIASERYVGQLAWCPVLVGDRGHWFVFVSTGHHGNTDLYLGRSDTETTWRLSSAPGFDQMPTWSPDGDALVFVSGGEELGDLMVIRGLTAFLADPTVDPPPPTLLVGSSTSDAFPVISPDGRWLLWSRRDLDGPTGTDLWAMPWTPDEVAAPFRVTGLHGEETRARFSPDARWLGFYYSPQRSDRAVDAWAGRVRVWGARLAVEAPRMRIPDVVPDTDVGPGWVPSSGQDGWQMVVLKRFDGATGLAVIEADGDDEWIELDTGLEALSGFDFPPHGSGVVCGQRETRYRVVRGRIG
jgi:hypothetical protein